jgi:fibronectin type 3 domain-containing protein
MLACEVTMAFRRTRNLFIVAPAFLSACASMKLSGTAPSSTHSVTLTWSAPANSTVPVAGYHVYRGNASSGSYILLNSSLTPATRFVDSTVTAGSSYVYEVKSVDANGVESAASNTFTATIP